MAVKYVFVTGGVVSGLGKGITAASLVSGMDPLTLFWLYAATPKTALILVTIILVRFFYHESDATFLFWYAFRTC